MRISTLSVALTATLLSLLLTSCGSEPNETTPSGTDPAPSSSTAPSDQASALTMTDPWVKAAKNGMTATFGTLVNHGTADVTVTSATSEIATTMELHETLESDDGTMAMSPKEGGFVISAGGNHELAPGGDHLMMMGLNRALKPGEVIAVTLTMQDGSTVDVKATVKNFTGADEKYQHEGMHADHPETDEHTSDGME